MNLTSKNIKHLKKLAHHLPCNVNIGKNNLSDNLYQTINHELKTHELIKIKVQPTCEYSVNEVSTPIVEHTRAKIIRIIGRTLLLYKQNPIPDEQKIKFN